MEGAAELSGPGRERSRGLDLGGGRTLEGASTGVGVGFGSNGSWTGPGSGRVLGR